MSRRWLVPLGIAVTALTALAAVAAHGRPLSGGAAAGSGPSATFLDQVFTIFFIFVLVAGGAVLWLILTQKIHRNGKRPGRFGLLATLLYLAGCAVVALALANSRFEKRLQHEIQRLQARQASDNGHGSHAAHRKSTGGTVHVHWEEVAAALALLAALGVAGFASRGRGRLEPLPSLAAQRDSLSAALDESLDDLRAERDLRRAIIAAYARMERALAAAGLPRDPAEAPLEYVERALVSLDASAGAVRGLTELFEWAKFSHHEPEPWMRDAAVDALVTVRDELRSGDPAFA
jgi:hypothetical protein